jgi:hypothetical protein
MLKTRVFCQRPLCDGPKSAGFAAPSDFEAILPAFAPHIKWYLLNNAIAGATCPRGARSAQPWRSQRSDPRRSTRDYRLDTSAARFPNERITVGILPPAGLGNSRSRILPVGLRRYEFAHLLHGQSNRMLFLLARTLFGRRIPAVGTFLSVVDLECRLFAPGTPLARMGVLLGGRYCVDRGGNGNDDCRRGPTVDRAFQ